MIRITQGGFQWEAEEDLLPHLPGLLASDGEVIKLSPAKKVTRHHAGGTAWFVKRYYHTFQPLRPYKFYFKQGQARQEWDIARRLAKSRVPVVRHAALGERWCFGLRESILVTEEYPGVSLETAANVDLAKVLEFVGRLHDRGVLQKDLHPGNILCHRTTGELCLVDVHGTVILPAVSAADRMQNLAFLRIFLPIPVSPECLERSRELRRDYLALRSERCLKHNRDFAARRLGGLTWRVRTSFPAPGLDAILAAPDAFLAGRAKLLKKGRSSTVGVGEGLVLKRSNLRKPLNLLKDCFRQSKARRAYLKAYHLQLAGIPTAQPVATADRRAAGLLLRSYFLMEEIPGATDLAHWRGDGPQAARDLGRLIGKLHTEGFSHRDLKETNLVFDARGELHIIDLEGLEFLRDVPPARAMQDLARLERGAAQLPGFSPPLRRIFLRHYASARGAASLRELFPG